MSETIMPHRIATEINSSTYKTDPDVHRVFNSSAYKTDTDFFVARCDLSDDPGTVASTGMEVAGIVVDMGASSSSCPIFSNRRLWGCRGPIRRILATFVFDEECRGPIRRILDTFVFDEDRYSTVFSEAIRRIFDTFFFDEDRCCTVFSDDRYILVSDETRYEENQYGTVLFFPEVPDTISDNKIDRIRRYEITIKNDGQLFEGNASNELTIQVQVLQV